MISYNHPLLQIFNKHYNQNYIKKLFNYKLFNHVVMYIVTNKNNIFLQKNDNNEYQTFGGCNFPNNIFRMINSLRLELMDESSILLSNDIVINISSLFIIDKCLIQVVYVKDDLYNLWNPEKAREKLGIIKVPDNIVLNKHNITKISLSGNNIYKLSFNDIYKIKWRNCDFYSLQILIKNNILININNLKFSNKKFFLSNNNINNNIIDFLYIYNYLLDDEIRNIALKNWYPILWTTASNLFIYY